MLSRVYFLTGKKIRYILNIRRYIHNKSPCISSPPSTCDCSPPPHSQPNLPPVCDPNDDKKTIQWPRPVRAEFSGKVRLGFIPDEWFQELYDKTGVTGPYVLLGAVSIFLISKEIYVLDHEYYTGLSILIMIIVGSKKLGPILAAYLDKGVDDIEKEWNDSREQSIKDYEQAVEDEKKEQFCAEGQYMLIEAKRENIALQLEAAYRERLMQVYQEVKRRLDYQVEIQTVQRRIVQKHMVNWVVDGVLKSISPEQQAATLYKCIDDLQQISMSLNTAKSE